MSLKNVVLTLRNNMKITPEIAAPFKIVKAADSISTTSEVGIDNVVKKFFGTIREMTGAGNLDDIQCSQLELLMESFELLFKNFSKMTKTALYYEKLYKNTAEGKGSNLQLLTALDEANKQATVD